MYSSLAKRTSCSTTASGHLLTAWVSGATAEVVPVFGYRKALALAWTLWISGTLISVPCTSSVVMPVLSLAVEALPLAVALPLAEALGSSSRNHVADNDESREY